MLLQAQGKMASYNQVKELYPETLFSVIPNEKTMREMGHYVEPTDRPEGDVVEMAPPTKNSKGVWQQNWTARNFTKKEREDLDKDEPETSLMPKEKPPFTYKTDVWDRMTEDEAEMLDVQISSLTAKEKGMWWDCIKLEHTSPWFNELKTTFVEKYGEQRTEELLAPSQED